MEQMGHQQSFPPQLQQALNLWQRHGAITPETEGQIVAHFDALVEGVLAFIDEHPKQPVDALGVLMLLFAIVNSCSPPTRYLLVSKLGGKINDLKEKVSKIADEAGASEYTITIGIPLGLSLSVTFAA